MMVSAKRRKISLQISIRSLYVTLSFCLFFMVVVIPNSLKSVAAGLMLVCFIYSLFVIKWDVRYKFYLALYWFSVIITLIYLLVGLNNNASQEAVQQVLIIYVISPMMWMSICVAVFRYYNLKQFINNLIFLVILCGASVALYFFLYLNYGASAVSFFIETANLNLNSGYAGATMFVYGSLIFLCSAFYAVPRVIEYRPLRFFVLGMLALCAITSGRSALILSIPVGIIIGIFLKTEDVNSGFGVIAFKKSILNLILVVVSIGFIFIILRLVSSISIDVVLGNFGDEVQDLGGIERREQAIAIWDGIFRSQGMGVGHGVGVEYVRNELFPWRYELVWLATILRVGFIGAFIYSIPFIFYIYSIIKLALKNRLNIYQKFYFAGFFAAFFASNTNPYIESIYFQWMYVLPLVAFFSEKKLTKV